MFVKYCAPCCGGRQPKVKVPPESRPTYKVNTSFPDTTAPIPMFRRIVIPIRYSRHVCVVESVLDIPIIFTLIISRSRDQDDGFQLKFEF